MNLNGAWHAVRFCLPYLVERCGAIVNVSSVQALATQENVCAYTVSKHGPVGLTRSLAVDFGGIWDPVALTGQSLTGTRLVKEPPRGTNRSAATAPTPRPPPCSW